MRKIKFRAWHKGLKKMFSAEEMGKDELTLAVDGRGFVNVSSVSPKLSGYAGDVMIPLQFTGLKDKNGNEIYEGDILRDRDTTYPVEWSNYRFRFSIQGKPKGFSHYQAFSFSSQIEKDAEIIGNIYENPGLLQ